MASARGRDLNLIVPGLFGPTPPTGVDPRDARQTLVAGLDLGALESLLSRARQIPLAHQFSSPEDLCFGLLGYRRADGSDWPVAALTRFADTGEAADGWYLRADPVHLKADMGDLVLFDGEYFDLSEDEALALAGAVSGYFDKSGLRLEVHHPLRWYLRLTERPELRTTALSNARARSVSGCLPIGERAREWRAYLNETQMLLHQSEVNETRAARGEAAINSLWFWGGGSLPDPVPMVSGTMFADGALARGLGALSNMPCQPLPNDGAAGILPTVEAEHVFVIIDDGFSLAGSSDVESWRRYIVDIEQNWMIPLMRALEEGGFSSLTVVTDAPVCFKIDPARWRDRVRPSRPFAELAEP